MTGAAEVPQNGSGHSRNNSDASHAQDNSAEEEFSPRSRTVKRPDPPINAQQKFYCNVSSECEGQTFDRKCEWG